MRISKLFGKGFLILVLSLMSFAAWNYADNNFLPFDSAAWKSNVDRPKQLNRLRRQYKLAGMNYQQIVQLLGKPNESSSKYLLYSWSEFMGVGFLTLRMESNQVIFADVAHD